MNALDNQMLEWGAKLRDDLGIAAGASNELATTINKEITELPEATIARVMQATPVHFGDRMDELIAFQSWTDIAHGIANHPAVCRAQVITQLYIPFVYLGDAWFKVLVRECGRETVTRKCCKYLTDNPVRAFRNAIAHGNWCYNTDFTGLKYWARKGSEADEPLVEFGVSQQDLDFWQSLARCTAYASFMALK